MKHYRLKSILACALAVVLALAGSSCAKNNASAPSGTLPSEISGTGPSWTWDTSPVTIKAFIGLVGYGYKWNTQIACMGEFTKNTGISIDMQSGDSTVLNALVASGNLPDVMVMDSVTNPTRASLEKNGLLWDFDTLIQKYAPDLQIPQSMKNWYDQEGKLYGYPSNYFAPEDFEKYPDVAKLEYHNKFIVRKDICDSLGIELSSFSTQDGFINALLKVKNASIVHNGTKLQTNYFHVTPDPRRLTPLFGLEVEDSSGNYQDPRFQGKYLEALQFINRMYREGLIPEDAWTASADSIKSKLAQGAVFSLFDTTTSGDVYSLQKVVPEATFVPVMPPASKSGGEPLIAGAATAGWTWLVIPKATKVPDRLIRMISFLASDEGQLLSYYGVKDTMWTLDTNGRIKFVPDVEKQVLDNFSATQKKYGMTFFPWCFNWMTYQRFNPVPSVPATIADSEINDYFRKFVYDGRAAENIDPDRGTDLLALQTKINNYWNQQEILMMRAASEDECTKVYNEAIAKIKEMGVQKIIDSQNEKFKANKVKAGQEFMLPTNRK